MHEPEVAHLGHPPELLGGDVAEGREHRGERHVHPHVDRPEELLDLPRGCGDLIVVDHVGADGERLAAGLLHVARRAVQAGLTASDQGDAGAALPEQARGGAPDSRAGPGHDNCLGLHVNMPAERAASGYCSEDYS